METAYICDATRTPIGRYGGTLAAIRTEVPDLPEVREITQFIESSRRGILSSHRSRRDGSRFDGAAVEAVEE